MSQKGFAPLIILIIPILLVASLMDWKAVRDFSKNRLLDPLSFFRGEQGASSLPSDPVQFTHHVTDLRHYQILIRKETYLREDKNEPKTDPTTNDPKTT